MLTKWIYYKENTFTTTGYSIQVGTPLILPGFHLGMFSTGLAKQLWTIS